MTATAQQVQMAAKLYEARDAMRRMLGERYAARMAELGGVLKKVSARDSVNEIQAAQVVIKAIDAQGYDALQLLAAAVELVEPTPPTYWHGGRPGRKRGEFLLPPQITGAPSSSDFGAAAVHRRDRVYITTDKAAALLFAAGWPDGVVYECEPIGAIEPDPDCNAPGMAFQCERARIVQCLKPSSEAIQMARAALFGSSS